jgi:hypothetical protein
MPGVTGCGEGWRIVRYAGTMRYPDGGELTAATGPPRAGAARCGRADRGWASDREIAKRFRASRMSANRGRRALAAGGKHSTGPIVLIWDNLPNHVSRTMRQLITARSWLTVIQLPAYAPELNAVEGRVAQPETKRSRQRTRLRRRNHRLARTDWPNAGSLRLPDPARRPRRTA